MNIKARVLLSHAKQWNTDTCYNMKNLKNEISHRKQMVHYSMHVKGSRTANQENREQAAFLAFSAHFLFFIWIFSQHTLQSREYMTSVYTLIRAASKLGFGFVDTHYLLQKHWPSECSKTIPHSYRPFTSPSMSTFYPYNSICKRE